MPPTLIVAPEDCYKHRTCPEPITRAGPEVPPENVNRLKVLTHPGVVGRAGFGKSYSCSLMLTRRNFDLVMLYLVMLYACDI